MQAGRGAGYRDFVERLAGSSASRLRRIMVIDPDRTDSQLGRWERRSEWPLAAIAVLWLAGLSVQVLLQPQGYAGAAMETVMFALWSLFVIDHVIRLDLATDRWRWFIRHIPALAAVALPFLRPLRLLRLPHLFGKLHVASMGALRGRLIVYTALSVVLVTYVAALAVLDLERETFHDSFGEALWWSITTVSTLGYGGATPNSTPGRMVAVVLALLGICLIGVVTATFSSWVIEEVAQEDEAHQAVTAAEIDVVRSDLAERIDELETGLTERIDALTAEVHQLTDRPEPRDDGRPSP